MIEDPEVIYYFTNAYRCAKCIDCAPNNLACLLKGEYKKPYINGWKISVVPREGVIEKFINPNVRYIMGHKIIETI
jgi:hypothetical protein